MLRSQVIRVAQTSATRVPALTKQSKRVRTYSTESPQSKSNNGLLIGTLVAAVGAGAYWYYSNPDEAARLQAKAKKDEEEAVQKAREAGNAAKASADKTIGGAEARVKQAANDAQAKFDEYKSGVSKSLSDARVSTENLYNDARVSADKKYGEAKSGVEEKKEQAKAGWFSWLGWGKSIAEDTKKSGAEKVADAAGDVQAKANKRT